MGSSYTEYNGIGFWTTDSILQLWLHLLTLQIHDSDDEWLIQLREHWRIQSGYHMGMGNVHPNLDDYLTNKDRAEKMIKLCQQVLKQLEQYDETIPYDVFSQIAYEYEGKTTYIDEEWTNVLNVDFYKLLGNYWIRLLHGEDVSSTRRIV